MSTTTVAALAQNSLAVVVSICAARGLVAKPVCRCQARIGSEARSVERCRLVDDHPIVFFPRVPDGDYLEEGFRDWARKKDSR